MSHPQVVLGLDFGGTKIAAAVCDLAGNKLASAVVSSLAELGATASFRHGIATATELLDLRFLAGDEAVVSDLIAQANEGLFSEKDLGESE